MELQSRRRVLAAMASMATLPLIDSGSAIAKAPFSYPGKLGIQLYMLAEEAGKDLKETLRQIARIGYREVELPHFFNRKPQDLAKAIADAGLVCPSMHIPLRPVWPNMPTLDSLDVVFDAVKALGATNVVVPLFPLPSRPLRPLQSGENGLDFMVNAARQMTGADWKAIAGQLNEKGALLAAQGVKLSYHNHNVEFLNIAGRGTAFDLLVAETDPSLVSLELDIGWVAAAGLDPVALVERHARRVRQAHLRDLRTTEPNNAIKINSVDIGTGIINWKRLLPALRRAGVEHYYVEQEPPLAGSPMDAAKTAFEFLQKAMAA